MNLFKNKNGDIYAYSDEDFINLAKQKYPYSEKRDKNTGEIVDKKNDFSNDELMAKGSEIVIDDYGYTPFSYTEEEIAAQKQDEENKKKIIEANDLLMRSIKLESGVYQRKMTKAQQSEFAKWQDDLLDFINGQQSELPTTPKFIEELL